MSLLDDNLVVEIPGPLAAAVAQDRSRSKSDLSSFSLPKRRVVHLDLKGSVGSSAIPSSFDDNLPALTLGAPPKIQFLENLFPLIRQAGANALLIEYEDMFPYQPPVSEASAMNSYTKEEILRILQVANDNHLEVIPLVQTFGHMEHVLKSAKFAHLREVSRYPESICPSQNESMTIITTMIRQVMDLHQGFVNYIHIGCDEVFHLASCSKCTQKLNRMNQSQPPKDPPWTGRHLFLEHVKKVATFVKNTFSVQPLIWDDMLRSISLDELRKAEISGLVEPVIWNYGEDVGNSIDIRIWQKYSAVFGNLWAASAFKGAFGERIQLPVVQKHHRNNLEWMQV